MQDIVLAVTEAFVKNEYFHLKASEGQYFFWVMADPKKLRPNSF